MMFMDVYKKWTLILSGVFTLLWLVFYFAVYVPANEILFYYTIIHVTLMLFFLPVTYGLECLVKELFVKYYTKAYRKFRVYFDVSIFGLFLLFTIAVTIFFGVYLDYTDLLWFILLTSMLTAIIFGSLEANEEF